MSPARTSKKPIKIDRDKLHRWLFNQSNPRSHRLSLSNTKVAELLDIRPDHMGRIVREMVEQKRMRKVSVARHRIATYEIIDPDLWVSGEKPPAPKPREMKWQ